MYFSQSHKATPKAACPSNHQTSALRAPVSFTSVTHKLENIKSLDSSFQRRSLPKFNENVLPNDKEKNSKILLASDAVTRATRTRCNLEVRCKSPRLKSLTLPPKPVRVHTDLKTVVPHLSTAVSQTTENKNVPISSASKSAIHFSKEIKSVTQLNKFSNICDNFLHASTKASLNQSNTAGSNCFETKAFAVKQSQEKKSAAHCNVNQASSVQNVSTRKNVLKLKANLTGMKSLPMKFTGSNFVIANNSASSTKNFTSVENREGPSTFLESKETTSHLKNVYYLQWKNKDALCWLDVALCLLVHSNLFHSTVFSCLQSACPIARALLDGYANAQNLFQKGLDFKRYQLLSQKRTVLLETGLDMIPVKTGGGEQPILNPDIEKSPLIINANLSPTTTLSNGLLKQHGSRLSITTEQLQKLADERLSEARDVTEKTREMVWKFLYPKLQCEKGDNDSPVFALPLMLSEDAVVRKKFEHSFKWHMTCDVCRFEYSDR